MFVSEVTSINFNATVFVLIFLVSYIQCVQESLYYNQLRIEGNKDFYPYEKFAGIRYENKSELQSVTLKKMEFNPHTLMNALEACSSLDRIELINVVWSESFKRKLHFPKLNSVKITRTKWGFAESASAEEFLDTLFFTTRDTKDLGDITIVFRAELGGSFVYYMEKLLVSQIAYDVQQHFSYKTLEAEKSVIDVSKFSGKGVTCVSLINSTLLNGSTEDLSQRFGSVTSLTLRHLLEKNETSTFDLKFLPVGTLTSLNLEGGKLEYSMGAPPVTFSMLTTLELNNLTIDPTGIQFPENGLTRIEIHNAISVTGGYEFIGAIKSLASLSLGGSSTGKPADFDLSLLFESRETLSSLELKFLNLSLSKRFVFTKTMGYLSFESCQLEASFLDGLSHVFKNAEFVNLDNQITDPILDAFLNTSVSELWVLNVGKIGKDNIGVKRFLKEANASMLQDKVSLAKSSNGKWEYRGSHPEDIEKGESTVFYAYISSLFIFCFVGIIGNVISVVVLSGKGMWSSTSCILITLALFDITILTTLIGSLPLYGFKLVSLFLKLYTFPFGLFGTGSQIPLLGESPVQTVTLLENIQAKFIYPLCKTAHTGSVYVTVLLTLERFMAVCYPLKIRFWTSKKKAVGMCLLILATAVLINFPRWFETSGSRIKVSNRRNPQRLSIIQPVLERVYDEPNILQERAYRLYYHGWIWALLMYVIPIPALCFLNTKIWLQIRSSVRGRRSLSTSATESDMTSLTVMLLCVSTFFILCNAVNGSIIWVFVSFGSFDPRDIEIFSCIPVILNSSTNFIIYCVLGKKFRRELLRLFSKCHGLGWLGGLSREHPSAVPTLSARSAVSTTGASSRSNHLQSPIQ